jgi:phospholipase C
LHVPETNRFKDSRWSARWIHRVDRVPIQPRWPARNFASGPREKNTRTPIKHVIVIIGEDRAFDHVFATYVPKSHDSVSNLLSKGIIKADGTPGPHFSKAAQFQAVTPFKKEFFINLDKSEKTPYQDG